MELRGVDREALLRISRMGGEGERVLSVFLSPELPRVPRPRIRGATLDSQLNEIGHRLRQEIGEEPAGKALDSCLDRVRSHLENAVVTDHKVRAVAVFREESGELEAYGLRRASGPFDRLVVGGPAEIWPLVDAKLHPYLGERLVGHVAIDVEHSTAEEVLEHVRGVIAEERRRREREAIERLAEGLGTGEGAAAGLTAVLSALDERRVATLLIGGGPLDEGVERAVEAAVAQSAEVLVVDDGALERFSDIAALLRY